MHNTGIDAMIEQKAKKQAATNGGGVRVISGNPGDNGRLQTNGLKIIKKLDI